MRNSCLFFNWLFANRIIAQAGEKTQELSLLGLNLGKVWTCLGQFIQTYTLQIVVVIGAILGTYSLLNKKFDGYLGKIVRKRWLLLIFLGKVVSDFRLPHFSGDR